MKTAKEKIDNLLKSFSIKQLYFAAVLPLLILGYILIAFSVWNVYLHQMKNTLALETQNAIMNKTDNFNGYFDSLYYATDSIIYSDITQQLLQKNVTLPVALRTKRKIFSYKIQKPLLKRNLKKDA